MERDRSTGAALSIALPGRHTYERPTRCEILWGQGGARVSMLKRSRRPWDADDQVLRPNLAVGLADVDPVGDGIRSSVLLRTARAVRRREPVNPHRKRGGGRATRIPRVLDACRVEKHRSPACYPNRRGE